MELSSWQILQSVLPMYGLIILGGFLRKWKVLLPEADGSLMKLVINCLYPLLIIDKILASEAVKDVNLILWTIPTGFLVITLSIFLAKVLAKVGKIPEGPVRNTFATTTGIQNYGFAAVPIIMALFPKGLLGVQFVHTLGVDIALWTVGIATLQGKRPKSFRSIFTGPVIAVLVGLVLVFTGLGDQIKSTEALSPIVTITNWLGACSFPIALMLVGATLSDELKQALPTIRLFFMSTLVRIILLPVIILSAIWLIPFPQDLASILVIQAAMPSAVMPIVLSRIYGGHPATAVQVVVTTQLIGIITIPLWITLGLYILSLYKFSLAIKYRALK